MNKAAPSVTVLIADDDPSIVESLSYLLKKEGPYRIITATSGKEAWQQLQSGELDVAFLDLTFRDLDAIRILEKAQKSSIETAIILITAYASVATAVEAMRKGAYDYLTKPVDEQQVFRIVHHVTEKKRLEQENRKLKNKLATLSTYHRLIGKSEAMLEIHRTIEAVAPTDASVLITGESGTGKELVARAIHKISPRSQSPFVAVNCAALPATILESELFGHVRGAFTGSIRDKVGFFEQANRGTLFLDEITELPYELQAKLLRALETRKLRRVGGQKEFEVDVRVLAATNRRPSEAVKKKILRDDLYFRLAVIEIELPPLRKRREDIPVLADFFLKEFSRSLNKQLEGFDSRTMKLLENYEWPGNIRELRNAIERAVILCRGEKIMPQDLPPSIRGVGTIPSSEAPAGDDVITVPVGTPVEEAERMLILRTLEKFNNNKTRAAKALGISLKTLHNKLARYKQSHAGLS